MKPLTVLALTIIAVISFLFYSHAHADEPKADPILVKIQAEASKMKTHKDYVRGFCDGVLATNWQEAAAHGWGGIPEDVLTPSTITFPNNNVYTCRKDK